VPYFLKPKEVIMARPKGVPNKVVASPPTLALSTEERIKALACLIVDRIEQRQNEAYQVAQEFEEDSDV
jgi:hypothetical protein